MNLQPLLIGGIVVLVFYLIVKSRAIKRHNMGNAESAPSPAAQTSAPAPRPKPELRDFTIESELMGCWPNRA